MNESNSNMIIFQIALWSQIPQLVKLSKVYPVSNQPLGFQKCIQQIAKGRLATLYCTMYILPHFQIIYPLHMLKVLPKQVRVKFDSNTAFFSLSFFLKSSITGSEQPTIKGTALANINKYNSALCFQFLKPQQKRCTSLLCRFRGSLRI